MEIVLTRFLKGENATIGRLFINGQFECFILEDKDRGLSQSMALADIQKAKVFAKTAIPTGRYEMAVTFSNRFKQYLPLIMGVPGFSGIRIHSGNNNSHTEGCPLTGSSHTQTSVSNSRAAFRSLFAKIKRVEKREKIFITIQ